MMRKSLTLILPVIIFLSILIPYITYLPMWDSGSYLSQCVLDAVSKPFNLLAFNCSNHGSIAFGLIYGLGQYISFGNSLLMHLTSFALLIIGFYFYHATLKHFFSDKYTILLGMLLLCLNPAIVANAINPTPDLTVLVFSIICLWAFLSNKLKYAAYAGVALVFSKESGVLFYTLSCVLYLLFNGFSKHRIREFAYLFLPFFAYALFAWYKMHYAQANLLFQGTSIIFLIKRLFFIDLSSFYDPTIFSAFYAIFILNFQWVVALTMIVGIAAVYVKRRSGQKTQYPFNNRDIMFVLLLMVSLSYVLSRYPHFLNIRYYILVFPLSVLVCLLTLQAANLPYWRVVMAGLLPLLFISCFYTIDPVSRALMGTFNFGRYQLLNMTSRTGECCGYGRDQLIYNLQHTELQTLLNKFARQVKLGRSDAIVADKEADFIVYERLGAPRFISALCLNHNNKPSITQNFEILKAWASYSRSARIYYPQLPNLNSLAFTQTVLNNLKPVGVTRVNHAGYEMSVMQLELEVFYA